MMVKGRSGQTCMQLRGVNIGKFKADNFSSNLYIVMWFHIRKEVARMN